MSLSVTCPNPKCGKSYPVAAEYLGRRGRCKSCGTEFVFSATNSASGQSAVSGSAENSQPSSGTGTSRTSRTSTPTRLGRFQIQQRVGMGGFGAVYRAQDPQLQRTVALKLLQSTGDDARDQHRINRFLVEGRAGARLQHPNIVPVFDAGKDEETGEYYMAAAFIAGQPLSATIDGQPLDLRRAATIVIQLARALEYAHTQGILHRDVKPDNVMLGEKDVPHLMDFGLARMEESESHLTRDGAVMGTPSYMSPEQCVGKQDALGPAADQYSLGCLFYELLTGEKLFDGPVSVQIHHQINTEAPPPSKKNANIPQDLDTICLKTLAKEPDRRYASCAALAADLEHWLADEPIRARQLTAWERWNRWRKRNPLVAGLSISTAALLLMVAVISTAAVFRLTSLTNAERLAKEIALAAEEKAGQQATEALEARGRAVQEKERADEKTAEVQHAAHILEREVYKQRIARAYQDWQDNYIRQAQQLLEECPEALRGWEWQYCARLCRQGLLTFDHHKAELCAAVFSPDGKLIATAAETGNLKIWEADTGEERFSFDFPLLKRYRARSQILAFNSDGKKLAAACEDGIVRIWDTATFQEIGKLQGLSDCASSLAFSPDGQRLAIGQASFNYQNVPTTGKVWDIATKQPVFTFEGQRRAITGIAYGKSGKQVVTVDWPGNIQFWNAETGALEQTMSGHKGGVICLALSPNEQSLATGGRDNTIGLWDAKSGRFLASLMGHPRDVEGLNYSPDGRLLVSCGERSVKIWEAATGQEWGEFRGHQAQVTSVSFAPDSRHVVSASKDGTAKIWDVTRDQRFKVIDTSAVTPHADWVRSVRFSSDNRLLATGAAKLQLYETDSEQLVPKPLSLAHPYSIDFTSDGKYIAAGGRNAAKIWAMDDGREVAAIPVKDFNFSFFVRFSPDSERLALASNKDIKIVKTTNGEVLQTYSRHEQFVTCVAFAPDGQHIASVSDDGVVRLWHASTGEDLFARRGPMPVDSWKLTNATGNTLAFSPNGELAVGGGDIGETGFIEIWNPTTGETVRTLRGHGSLVSALTFNRDGTRLASAALDGWIKIWHPMLGEELFSLQDDAAIISIDFSPDGQRLATGGINQSAKIWDASPP